MKFGICAMMKTVPEYVEWARLVDDCGYDMLAYGDTQNLIPEMMVTLTAMSMAAPRPMLCTTISNPMTRHVTVAASGFAALQQVANGRAVFGIGTGDSAVHNMGGRAARVDEMREYCTQFKQLVRGHTVQLNGHDSKMLWPTPDVPIYLAAEGPRMMRLAGEIADGVIFGNGISRPVVEDNLRRVREAAVAAGRDPDGVEPWFFTKVILSDRPEAEVWHDYAWTLAGGANHAFRYTFDGKFVPPELEAPLRRLMDGYRSAEHNQAHSPDHNANLVRDNGLTEFLGERFLIAGSAEHAAARLREMASWGATNVVLTAIWGDPLDYTRRFAEEVLPLI